MVCYFARSRAALRVTVINYPCFNSLRLLIPGIQEHDCMYFKIRQHNIMRYRKMRTFSNGPT